MTLEELKRYREKAEHFDICPDEVFDLAEAMLMLEQIPVGIHCLRERAISPLEWVVASADGLCAGRRFDTPAEAIRAAHEEWKK